MPRHRLAFKPATHGFGSHDPSAALFADETVRFGVEEERLTRDKHATGTFPHRAIDACLDHAGLSLADVDEVVLPYEPDRWVDTRLIEASYKRGVATREDVDELSYLLGVVDDTISTWRDAVDRVRADLADAHGEPVPELLTRPHHRCHAASAFHFSSFEEATVLTVDGSGETDSTVVWHGTPTGLERVTTYDYPNSLGQFFGTITEFLGFRYGNGEGKVMGLAPYGEADPEIRDRFDAAFTRGASYDVTELTELGVPVGIQKLTAWFDREPTESTASFDQWEKNLAHETQSFLEATVLDIVETHCDRLDCRNVCLAGGVVLNCKMNGRIERSPAVDETFVQPVAHDGGLALGAGVVDSPPSAVEPMETVYLGPEFPPEAVRTHLEREGVPFERPADPVGRVAERLADGDLIGWFQGRTELGPRALGNRSILADPRHTDARDRVNAQVKHREEWRPFAPSMTAAAADRYLVGADRAPFMIRAFDTTERAEADIPAVLHPADASTRPQVVTPDSNPVYHDLLTAFGDHTGVPVLLNTSFNDRGEPIVNTPAEALADLRTLGLDAVVFDGQFVVESDAGADG